MFYNKRYTKNHNAITEEEQLLLSKKTITVIGCGGLGGHIVSQLARIGVGHLRIVEFDTFDATNLNRQIFCHTENIGFSKIIETEKQLKLINPDIQITSFPVRFTEENSSEVLKDSDIAIDALDSVASRLILQKACKNQNIPLVSAAIGGWYGQLTIIYPGDDTLDKIYKDPKQKGIETELGNPAFTPALLATLQVTETVKILLGKSNFPANKVLIIDLLNLDFKYYALE